MAKELQAFLDPSLTLYAVLLNSTGQAYNTDSEAFETINPSNWTDYDIAMTEGTAGIYTGDMPAVVVGNYSYAIYARAGATPAITDELLGNGSIEWDGTAEVIETPETVSVADVKVYLGITGAADDALLTSLINKATKYIETYTGRVFTVAADSTRYLIPGEDSDGLDLYLPWDLCAITSVKVDADGATPITLTLNTDYIVLPRDTTPYYMLRMMINSAYSWSYETNPERGVEIIGRWGYSTTPPQDIIFCTMRLAAYYYRQKDSSVFDVTAMPDAGVIMIPQGIPKDVKAILDNYRRVAL